MAPRRTEALLLILFSFVALVLAIIALRRTRANKALAARLEALEREVRALRLGSVAAPAAPPEVVTDAPSAVADGEPAAEPEPVWAEVAPPIIPVDAASPPSDGPPPAEPPPPSSSFPSIDWERLFGVRAAAVLGGIALALAGLLFFKYSIEHGLIPPWLRVVMGTVAGVGCIATAEWTLRRQYAGTANALAGAGIVVLYAAFWAASARYDLVPMGAGFVLMVAVTAAGCMLAARHASLEIALLGLAGGFATPLLLSTGADRPIGLFGYVLLLDVALLVLAQRRRWPALALLSLAGTVFYEVSWIGLRMGPERMQLGLAILALFAIVFVLAGHLAGPEDRDRWRWPQAAAVAVPFAFALYFAADADFGPNIHSVAALLVLLSLAASWLARVQGPPELALGAAAASLGVVAVWVLARAGSAPDWQLALWSCAIAGTFHLFVERDRARAERDGPAPPAILTGVGFFLLLIHAGEHATRLWPWIAGWAGLAALLVRHAGFPGREVLHSVAAVGVGLGFAAVEEAQASAPWFPGPALYVGILVAACIAFQAVALIRRTSPARQHADHAAALLPVIMLISIARAPDGPALVALGGTLVLGLLSALAATRLGSGAWLLAAFGATALVHYGWAVEYVSADTPASTILAGLALQGLAVVLFTAWPFLVAARFRHDVRAWAAAALTGPAWFLALKHLFELRFGSQFIGLLPIALAALSLLAVLRARTLWSGTESQRTAALAWFAAVALGFTTVAIPLQLEREWITLGWALEGFAVLVLWTRLDHPGLKYFGLALLAAVTVRLVVNPAVLGYYPRPTWRLVNWLLYTYLVPAAALLGASRVLMRHELERARPWERARLYAHGWPLGALAAGFAGLVVVFVWINLAIADWFSTGPNLEVSFERLPARDLTTSIAWALYALLLLGLGMARRSIGLRWVSLGLLLVTIAKVFLYDLGELRDLYRVASLLGLAISLILVSLAYQRFVFRTPVQSSGGRRAVGAGVAAGGAAGREHGADGAARSTDSPPVHRQ